MTVKLIPMILKLVNQFKVNDDSLKVYYIMVLNALCQYEWRDYTIITFLDIIEMMQHLILSEQQQKDIIFEKLKLEYRNLNEIKIIKIYLKSCIKAILRISSSGNDLPNQNFWSSCIVHFFKYSPSANFEILEVIIDLNVKIALINGSAVHGFNVKFEIK